MAGLNMEDDMDANAAVIALQTKRLELRVAYMEDLHAQGKEDALMDVALPLCELREWIHHEHHALDRVAIGLLVARHLQIMPLRRADVCDARALSVEILRVVATNDHAILTAARVAVALFDGDAHALLRELVAQIGPRLETDETQLWRTLIVTRNVLRVSPPSVNYDHLLYHPVATDDGEDCSQVRVADLINDGLASAIVGCRIEAVRVLRCLALYLQLETGRRALEILLDASVEEANGDAAQFILANVWEMAFLRPQLALSMQSKPTESCLTTLLDTLRASSAKLRRVSVHGALRAIVHAKTSTGFELELLSQIVQIYASGAEHDTKCQELIFDFFEDKFGKSQIHQDLAVNAVVQGTRETYLAGLPLPAARATKLSKMHVASEEVLLHRRNKLVMSKLNDRSAKEAVGVVKLMLLDEFSSSYSAKRVAEVLGAPSRP